MENAASLDRGGISGGIYYDTPDKGSRDGCVMLGVFYCSDIAHALDGLSDVQRCRLLMLAEGKSMREIAREEKVQHRAVVKSGVCYPG